jgi:hypothetical protein
MDPQSMDPMSKSMPTHPAAKGVLVDQYAQIALFDAEENQRQIMANQTLEAQKKRHLKQALDEQVRVKQAAMLKERAQEREWLVKEQARVKVWNAEEARKIAEEKSKADVIRSAREQQLREQAALKARDEAEMREYEIGILKDIHKELQKERAIEAEKRRRDEENLKVVAIQNERHLEELKLQKAEEFRKMRALEAQWSSVLDKQERARTRQLALTYSRQAKQYAASESMQEKMNKQGAQDEERALARQLADEEAAREKVRAERAHRAQLQQDCLDVLAIQVRDKQVRAQANARREAAVVEREAADLKKAEINDATFRQSMRMANYAYAQELQEQRRVQETRKTLEPFLMSRAERQMNAAMLRRLPA